MTTNRRFFVTGTNTEVGKTYVTCLLARAFRERGHQVGVYKPVASGCRWEGSQLVADDAVALWKAAGTPLSVDDVTPQRFEAALAPNVAAQREGTRVDSARIRSGLTRWSEFPTLLVEGVGGLMSPISDEDLVLDVAKEFEMPLILVVGNRLGCINSTLLSLNVAKRAGLLVAGVFLNDCEPNSDESGESNLQQILRWADVPFVDRVHFGQSSIDVEKLST